MAAPLILHEYSRVGEGIPLFQLQPPIRRDDGLKYGRGVIIVIQGLPVKDNEYSGPHQFRSHHPL